jgi:D-3-phosphoglycerate dehydrogenase
MQPGVQLINVSRGQLVDEDALVHALRQGHVGGAALDVFQDEPLSTDHPLCSLDNVILGSHNASNTREAVHRVSRMAIDNLVRELRRSDA